MKDEAQKGYSMPSAHERQANASGLRLRVTRGNQQPGTHSLSHSPTSAQNVQHLCFLVGKVTAAGSHIIFGHGKSTYRGTVLYGYLYSTSIVVAQDQRGVRIASPISNPLVCAMCTPETVIPLTNFISFGRWLGWGWLETGARVHADPWEMSF